MKVAFVGPSLYRHRARLVEECRDLVFKGPAKAGDLASAVKAGAWAIGLIDGVFDDTQSVWHKELLFALDRGVRLAGGASMGALRAAECHRFGMIGIGQIYRGYANGSLTDDAAVAELHAPVELNYLPLTEPLVNVESTLAKLRQSKLVADEVVDQLVATAAKIHFRKRTYAAIIADCRPLSTHERKALKCWLNAFKVDQKEIDALQVISWLTNCDEDRVSGPKSWAFEATTQWQALLASLDRDADSLAG